MSRGVRRILRTALLVLCAACGGSGADAIGGDSQDQTAGETLPLREVSGLAMRDGRFVAVGDRSSTVVTFALKDGKLAGVAEHTPLPEAGSGGSQYEAVAFDGKGNVVVMAETGAIAVLDADCAKVIASSTIDWTSANPLVDGRVEDNSLGEGLVVLDETHVLVALEKRPSAIVELGPKGDAPRGFSPGARASSAFSPPSELVALAAWKVDDAHAPDLSELTIGPDGALWALSQQGNTIVRFERTLRPGEARARVTDHVNLPSDLEGVEGLAFDGDRPVVARDRSATKKNVFVLDPIAL
jgi:uncharacterized protein YjiK